MSETVNTTAAPAAEQAAPAPKPKRPKAKSLLMIGEQTNALFESARLAKERGEKVGWSASIFPQEIASSNVQPDRPPHCGESVVICTA